MVIGLSGVQFGLQSRVWLQTELDDTKSCYQLIIKITVSEKKKNNQVTKKREKLHWNTDKGGVNILRLLAKTQKQARAHAHVITKIGLFNCPITNFIFFPRGHGNESCNLIGS